MASSIVYRILLYELVSAVELLGGPKRILTLENLITSLCSSPRLVRTLCSLLHIQYATLADIPYSSSVSTIDNPTGPLYRRRDNDEQERKLAELVWNIGAQRHSLSCNVQSLLGNLYRYSITNVATLLPSSNDNGNDDDDDPTAATNTLPVYRVLYDFTAEGPGELTVRKDTLLLGLPWEHFLQPDPNEQDNPSSASLSLSSLTNNPPPEGWLLCIHMKSAITNIQETGYLPLSYLRLIDDELSEPSFDYLHSLPSVTRILAQSSASSFRNYDTANNAPLSPLTTVAQSLKSWANKPQYPNTDNVSSLTPSRPPVYTLDPSSMPSHGKEVLSSPLPLSYPSSLASSVSSVSSLRSPVFATKPITNDRTVTGPGPLTTRKQIFSEARKELENIRSGKYWDEGFTVHREEPIEGDRKNLHLKDLASVGTQGSHRRRPPPPPTPASPSSLVSPSPGHRSSRPSFATVNHKATVLNSPLMKPFRGTSTENDILNAVKIVQYNFTGLGTGELSVNEGDYVLPFPDQSECAPGWTLVFHVPVEKEESSPTTDYAVGYVPSVYLVPLNGYPPKEKGRTSGTAPGIDPSITETVPANVTEASPAPIPDNEASVSNVTNSVVNSTDKSTVPESGATEISAATNRSTTADDELSVLLNVVLPSTRQAEATRNKAEQEANAYVQGYGDAMDRLRIELDLSLKEMNEKISKIKESIRLSGTGSSSADLSSVASSLLPKPGTKHNGINGASSLLTKLYAELHDIENDRVVVQRQLDMLTTLENQHKDIFTTRMNHRNRQPHSNRTEDGTVSRTDTPSLLRPVLPTDDFPLSVSGRQSSGTGTVAPFIVPSSVPSSYLSVPKDSRSTSLSLSSSNIRTRRRAPPLPPVMAQFQQLQHTDRRMNDFTNHVKLTKPSSSLSFASSSSSGGTRTSAWNPALTPAVSSAPSLSSSSLHPTPRISTPYTNPIASSLSSSSIALSSVYPSFLTQQKKSAAGRNRDTYSTVISSSSLSSSMIHSRSSGITMATPKSFLSTPTDPSLVVARFEPVMN